jgi:hypothetical protein
VRARSPQTKVSTRVRGGGRHDNTLLSDISKGHGHPSTPSLTAMPRDAPPREVTRECVLSTCGNMHAQPRPIIPGLKSELLATVQPPLPVEVPTQVTESCNLETWRTIAWPRENVRNPLADYPRAPRTMGEEQTPSRVGG